MPDAIDPCPCPDTSGCWSCDNYKDCTPG